MPRRKTPTNGRPPDRRIGPSNVVAEPGTPLRFLVDVINNEDVSDTVRMKAAIAACRFMHLRPKPLGVREAKLEAAKAAAATSDRFRPNPPPAKLLPFKRKDEPGPS